MRCQDWAGQRKECTTRFRKEERILHGCATVTLALVVDEQTLCTFTRVEVWNGLVAVLALKKHRTTELWSRPSDPRPTSTISLSSFSHPPATMSAIPSTEPPASPDVEKKAPATAPKKKRNIKALQLNVEPASAPAPAPPPIQLAGRSAKAPGAKPAAKRKPPKMDLAKSKGAVPNDGKKVTSPGLLTVDAPGSAPASRNRTSYHSKLSEQLANLDVGADKLDLKLDDLEEMRELGAGNGGTVKLVKHVPTQTTMAKKVSFFHHCF